MEQISEWFKYLMNSEDLIRTGGLITITLIIFIENGIIFGFFLPGDYLLFLSGVFCGTKMLNVPVSLLMFCVFVAAVLGSLLGYIIGRYFGDGFQTRPDSLFFKKKYIENTSKYYEKNHTTRVRLKSKSITFNSAKCKRLTRRVQGR
jgi:membrane-associated protein